MIRTRGSLKRGGRRRDLGQAMIEFSLAMSILLVPIVMGVAGFAAYLGNYIALTDAVSYGARELSMSRGASTTFVNDPCALVTNVVNNAYKAAAIESGTPTLTVTLTVYDASGAVDSGFPNSSGSCSGTTYLNDLVIGGTVKVNVTHITQSIFGSFGSFTIAAQTQEMVQ